MTTLTAEEILCALADERFISLDNCDTSWQITYKGGLGEKLTISDEYFDRLIGKWVLLTEVFKEHQSE